ncbi:MAG: glycolate oxidase subunit GlcE [Betaproteobacteria bacterium HGW-Betaproteobacteria-10]|nr:MAG: glycolate oxidase subunit GlcE [Betaproteobacteria bacterium HGW-Betaproteobacteria-10]
MHLDDLVSAIKAAHASQTQLRIRGAGSKDFYGGLLLGDVLDVADYRGIVAYEPSELYITAKCGTPLAEIEAVLAEKGQMLAFEPPHFAAPRTFPADMISPGASAKFTAATVGGCVAAGLAGPRRQQAGAVRDFVLGIKLIDGRGQVLDFGGQVMKNVAGYDVSRLLVGSLGTLGVLAEVTLKVLPKPRLEQTLVFAMSEIEAIAKLNDWGGQPWPISASFWHDSQLWLRLSGAQAAVVSAAKAASGKLGGKAAVDAEKHWISVREQTHTAFVGQILWRLALPSTAKPPGLSGLRAMEWGGAERWYAGEPGELAEAVRGAAARAGGHATLYRAPESLRCREGAFAPLSPALLALHRRLKKIFDPKGILNPGRLYAEF